MYSGYLLPSVYHHDGYIIWGLTEVHWCFFGISSFAVGIIVHYLESSHMSLKSSRNLHSGTVKFFYKERTCSSPSHMSTQAGLELKPHDLWFGRFPCFMFNCLTCYQPSSFLCGYTNSTVHCFVAWKCPFLRPLKDFWVVFAFIGFRFCCLHPHIFDSTLLNFVAVLQLFIFLS
jgi:cbb3-type cytochrome oxidase subunit 1